MTTQEDMDSVYALLAVLADPKAAKERLDGLVSAHQQQLAELAAAHEKALAESATLADVKAGADDQRQTAEATLMAHRLEVARFQKDMESYQKDSAAQKQKLADKQDELDKTLVNLNAERSRLIDLRKELDTRAELIKRADTESAAHFAAATKAHADAAALKKTYEDRVAALRSAMAD